ncbi:hypothetical protein [Algoriphagus confluentis]
MAPIEPNGGMTYDGYVDVDENGNVHASGNGGGKDKQKQNQERARQQQEWRNQLNNDIRRKAGLKVNENLATGMEAVGLSLPSLQVNASRIVESKEKYELSLGSKIGISINITPISGYALEFGWVWDRTDDGTFYISFGESAGFDASIGFEAGSIKSHSPDGFRVENYRGYGSSDNVSYGIYHIGYGGDNFLQRHSIGYGKSYYEMTGGGSIGSPIGYSRQFTYTYLPFR